MHWHAYSLHALVAVTQRLAHVLQEAAPDSVHVVAETSSFGAGCASREAGPAAAGHAAREGRSRARVNVPASGGQSMGVHGSKKKGHADS
jgi:hypothetical protein